MTSQRPSRRKNPPLDTTALMRQDARLLGEAQRLARAIADLPHEPGSRTAPRALIVGGFARDALLGLRPKDMDIEVYGVSPDRLLSVLKKQFPGRVSEVGKAFGVLKVNLGAGLDLDISIPRRESKTGHGHKDFRIHGDPTMTVKEAARRRDFTMNALAADPLTGEYIDPFDGIADLQRRVLRVTDDERFQDDPLRVLRAVQFAARMDLTVEPHSLALLSEMVARGDLDHLPPERITEELTKLLLKAERPSVGFEVAKEIGIVERHWPELNALLDVEQEPDWHPEGDVWIHTMMVLDAAAVIVRRKQDEPGFRRWISTDDPEQRRQEQLMVMLGALCHDLGKPSTTEHMHKGGAMRVTSHGHEAAGVGPATAFMERLMFAREITEAVVAVTRDHLQPSVFARQHEAGQLDDRQYTNAVRKLIKRLHPTPWYILVAVSESDSRGRALPEAEKPYTPGEHMLAAISRQKLDVVAVKGLVSGKELMALFGLKQGPEIGQWLKQIEATRDAGEIETHEQAIEWLSARLRRVANAKRGRVRNPELLPPLVFENYDDAYSHDGVNYDTKDGVASTSDNANVRYKGLTVIMSPERFLSLARHLPASEVRKGRPSFFDKAIKDGTVLGPPTLYVDLEDPPIVAQLEALRPVAVVPVKVYGHEGRHRVQAMQRAGVKEVPVQIHARGFRARHYTTEILDIMFDAGGRWTSEDGKAVPAFTGTVKVFWEPVRQ